MNFVAYVTRKSAAVAMVICRGRSRDKGPTRTLVEEEDGSADGAADPVEITVQKMRLV
jgi:hypothetical protein